jgi:hypothetical protein
MDWIYCNASALLIYLGEFSEAQAVHLSRKVRQECEVGWWLPKPGSIRKKSTIRFLQTILNMPWFDGRWVIQDYALSPNTYRYLMLGDLLVDDGVFETPLCDCNLLPPSGLLNSLAVRGQLSLEQALFLHRSAKCSHPLDRVYALMSLVTIEYKRDLRINYSMSEINFYHQVATSAFASPYCIDDGFGQYKYNEYHSREQCIFAFAAATCFKTERRLQNPESLIESSWAPNWSRNATYTCPEHQQAVEEIMKSNIGIQTPACDEKYRIYIDSIDKGCVRLTGLLMYLCPPSRLYQDGSCVSCSVFRRFRVLCSPEFEQRLAVVANQRYPLYVPIHEERSPDFFVLRRTEALLDQKYPMHVLDYCFLGPPLPSSIEQQSCPEGSFEFGTIVIR